MKLTEYIMGLIRDELLDAELITPSHTIDDFSVLDFTTSHDHRFYTAFVVVDEQCEVVEVDVPLKW